MQKLSRCHTQNVMQDTAWDGIGLKVQTPCWPQAPDTKTSTTQTKSFGNTKERLLLMNIAM